MGGREPLLMVLLLRFAPYFETTEPVTVDPEIFVVVEQVYNAPNTLLDPEIAKSAPILKIRPLIMLPLIISPPFE